MPQDWLEEAVFDALTDYWPEIDPEQLTSFAHRLASRIEQASRRETARIRAAMEAHTVNAIEWTRSPTGQQAVHDQIMDGAAILRGEPVPEREPVRPPCVGWIHLSEGTQDPPPDIEYGTWSCSLCFKPAAQHATRLVREQNVGEAMVPRPWHPGELEAKYAAWERPIIPDRRDWSAADASA